MAAYHQLALAYEKKGDIEKARTAYEKTLQLATQSGDQTMIAEMQNILDQWED